jgi:hypothetical protein
MEYLGNAKSSKGWPFKIHAVYSYDGHQFYTFCNSVLRISNGWNSHSDDKRDVTCESCQKKMQMPPYTADKMGERFLAEERKDDVLFIVIHLNGKYHTTLPVFDEEEILPAIRRCLASWADSLIVKHLENGDITIYRGEKLGYELNMEPRIEEIRLLD